MKTYFFFKVLPGHKGDACWVHNDFLPAPVLRSHGADRKMGVEKNRPRKAEGSRQRNPLLPYSDNM
jgi:hypothetical protein